VQTGNTVPHISGAQIGAFRFQLPPLADQARIAATIDTFDHLSSAMAAELPTEIVARRKQYRYYRDKLLAFEAVVA
jgi:type I restriction enzyme S subunit